MLSLMLALVETPEEKKLFREIYDLHEKWMLKTAYDILKNYEDAGDAVNEAFFRLARRFREFDIQGADSNRTRGLLLILVKNEARRIYKKESRRRSWEMAGEDPGRTEDETILTDIRARMILQELLKMGPTYRDVLYLHFMEGQSNRNIASELGIPVSTVKKRIERGKEILIKRAEMWGEGDLDE